MIVAPGFRKRQAMSFHPADSSGGEPSQTLFQCSTCAWLTSPVFLSKDGELARALRSLSTLSFHNHQWADSIGTGTLFPVRVPWFTKSSNPACLPENMPACVTNWSSRAPRSKQCPPTAPKRAGLYSTDKLLTRCSVARS